MIICKFNILEFKRGDEQGSQKQFPCASLFEKLSFCLAYENGQKKAQIRRPNLFPRASILKKFLGCRDPRWKHEYLDSSQIWITTGEEEEELDESDKHM